MFIKQSDGWAEKTFVTVPAFPECSHDCAQQGVRVLLVDLEQLERPGSLVAACMFRKFKDFRSWSLL
jgi:hypothetical protein